MTKIKEITYPITVYQVDEDNIHFSDGSLEVKTFEAPPTNYDTHLIRGKKFIWEINKKDFYEPVEYYLNKKDAQKAAISWTKKRIKEYQDKMAKLKKQLKEIRAL